MSKIVAHRGWSSRSPENTLSSIKLAVEEEKIDMIEIDVQLTKDNRIVLLHDFFIDRTSDGSGYLGNYKYKELLNYDFGSWYSEKFKGERIPTLEDVLNFVNGKKDLVIEIKRAGIELNNISECLIDLIKDYKYKEKLYIKSFNHDIVKQISELDNSLNTGILVYGLPNLIKEQVWYSNSKFVSLNYGYVTKECIKELYENGTTAMLWTVDEKEHIDLIKSIYDDIPIVTNYPERCF